MRVTIRVTSDRLGDTEHERSADFLQAGREREILNGLLEETTEAIRRMYQLDK